MEAFANIEVGPIMSTKMLPHPEISAVESFISLSLEILYKMIVSSGDLILTGAMPELQCCRHEEVFAPITSYK
jgi:hypothetical protein